MLVTYRYKFVALKRFVPFKYNFVAIIFCHNQKSNRIQKVILGETNQKYIFVRLGPRPKTKLWPEAEH